MLLRARLTRHVSVDYIVSSVTDLGDAGIRAESYDGRRLGPFGPPVVVSLELGYDAHDLDRAYADLVCWRCEESAARLCDCGTALCGSHGCTRECYQRARPVDQQRERGVVPRETQGDAPESAVDLLATDGSG